MGFAMKIANLFCGRIVRCVVLLPFLAPWLAGCASDSSVISQATQFHGGIEPAVFEDQRIASYMQQVGDRIIAVAREMDGQGIGPKAHKSEDSKWMFGKNMKFHLVNSKTLNAFTTGGEHMYIYVGLAELCRDEDEMAAVMAHEFAHIYGRHVQKGMNRQMAILGGAAALGAAGYAAGGKDHGGEYAAAFAGAGLVAGQFIGMGFTRGDEAEADEYGFQFYVRAGWDPKKFPAFFQTMIDKGYDKTPEMLSDHPSLANRVKQAKQWIAQLPPHASQWRLPPVASQAQYQQVLSLARDLGKHMKTDETLSGAQELLAAMPRSCWVPMVTEDEKQARARLEADLKKKQTPNK